MKPSIKLGLTLTPDGNEITLYQHDRDFFIRVNKDELMSTRRNKSELALGKLGCAHLGERDSAKVLIGGLGMGYTVRATLDALPDNATVVVAELLPEVVRWNREIFGHISNFPLNDKRVQLVVQDIFEVLKNANSEFDAILLDVDNGPEWITDSTNDRLYTDSGIATILQALKKDGRLGIWSANCDDRFEAQLKTFGLKVLRYEVSAYDSPKARTHVIWIVKNPNL